MIRKLFHIEKMIKNEKNCNWQLNLETKKINENWSEKIISIKKNNTNIEKINMKNKKNKSVIKKQCHDKNYNQW